MSKRTQEWARAHGWRPFSETESHLCSVSCLLPPREQSTAPIVAALRRRGYLVDDGYGQLKGRILRIGHMGDWQEDDLEGLLRELSEALPEAR